MTSSSNTAGAPPLGSAVSVSTPNTGGLGVDHSAGQAQRVYDTALRMHDSIMRDNILRGQDLSRALPAGVYVAPNPNPESIWGQWMRRDQSMPEALFEPVLAGASARRREIARLLTTQASKNGDNERAALLIEMERRAPDDVRLHDGTPYLSSVRPAGSRALELLRDHVWGNMREMHHISLRPDASQYANRGTAEALIASMQIHLTAAANEPRVGQCWINLAVDVHAAATSLWPPPQGAVMPDRFGQVSMTIEVGEAAFSRHVFSSDAPHEQMKALVAATAMATADVLDRYVPGADVKHI